MGRRGALRARPGVLHRSSLLRTNSHLLLVTCGQGSVRHFGRTKLSHTSHPVLRELKASGQQGGEDPGDGGGSIYSWNVGSALGSRVRQCRRGPHSDLGCAVWRRRLHWNARYGGTLPGAGCKTACAALHPGCSMHRRHQARQAPRAWKRCSFSKPGPPDLLNHLPATPPDDPWAVNVGGEPA